MRIFFIINIKRRDQGPESVVIDQIRQVLDESGAEYELVLCESIEHTETCLADAVKREFDTLWVGGGDGTINHALNYTFGKGLVYGFVPMGTVNALGRSLRLPLDPVECVRYLLSAKAVPMDIGCLNRTHHFFTYATVGIHAAVFHNIDTRLKRRWGKIAFWESAVRTLWNKSRLPRFVMEMELIDEPAGQSIIRDYGYSFTLANVANYAGFSTLTAEDPASPGYFELHHFRRNRLMPMVVWLALLRWLGIERSKPESGRIFRKIRWVRVRSHRNLSVQIDGEPIKPTDRKNLNIECLDDAVQILLQPAEAARLVMQSKVKAAS